MPFEPHVSLTNGETSVLSALQGIQSVSSRITQKHVIIMAVVLLVALFIFQQCGTSKVSFSFSPIMLMWFGSNIAIGVYNIVKYEPSVFKALSPHYIIIFFSRNGVTGWTLLGAIFLCITGAEAMFADLGHFNKNSIQLLAAANAANNAQAIITTLLEEYENIFYCFWR
ncbi:unnamed protein product [Camellia sinensis]